MVMSRRLRDAFHMQQLSPATMSRTISPTINTTFHGIRPPVSFVVSSGPPSAAPVQLTPATKNPVDTPCPSFSRWGGQCPMFLLQFPNRISSCLHIPFPRLLTRGALPSIIQARLSLQRKYLQPLLSSHYLFLLLQHRDLGVSFLVLSLP